MKGFCVPYIDHPQYLASLFEEFGGKVDEIYLGLPSSHAGSARAIYYRDIDYKRISDVCHDHGVKVDVLLNAACEGLEPYTPRGLKDIMTALKKVVHDGVDVVTVANPLYIPKIKDSFKVEVKASIIALVHSAQRAVFFEELGADAINLDRDINRDLEKIKEIKESVDCRLHVLVNEGCLFECPFKQSHDNMIGHLSRIPPNQRTCLEANPFAEFCTLIKEERPEEILKSPWIRPEDLRHYKRLVDGFKIAGRELTKERMMTIIGAYASESYDGNLMDLLNVTTPGVSIPNKRLDGFFKKVAACDKRCVGCGYCRDLAKRLIKHDLKQKELISL